MMGRCMANMPDRTRMSYAPVNISLLLLVGLSIMASGCSSGRYDARRLPPELVAQPIDNLEKLDLSRLGGFAASNELIDCGDVLEVTIVTDYIELPPYIVPVRVGADGMANVPQIGKVRLAGLEMEEAERVITNAAIQNGIYRNPHVTATMKQQRVNHVTVVGAVLEPGTYELPRSSSYLLAAIVSAGGLAPNASPVVEIRRSDLIGGGPQPSRPPSIAQGAEGQLAAYHQSQDNTPWVSVNLVSAAQKGDGGYYLNDGDVVMVAPRSRKPIQVLGLVVKAGAYDMPLNEDLYLLDALAMAGDRTTPLADKVLIIRQIPGQAEPARIQLSIRDAKNNGAANIRLAEGDIVTVEQTPVTFVWDTLQKFFRFNVGSSVVLF
jgi:polysaccharide export outer membrane protein